MTKIVSIPAGGNKIARCRIRSISRQSFISIFMDGRICLRVPGVGWINMGGDEFGAKQEWLSFITGQLHYYIITEHCK